MTRCLLKFGEFITKVFWESGQKAFTLFDILGVVLFFLPNIAEMVKEETLIRILGGLIFLISFLLANFAVYLKSATNQAEIRLTTTKQYLSPSRPSRNPFRDVESSPYGFNSQGLPDWASLYAEVRIANVGHEGGRLLWKHNQTRTKLPPLFSSGESALSFQPTLQVPARESSSATLFFDVLFSEHDPQAFAVGLKALVQRKERYMIVIDYWTERIDGESSRQELKITGDFNEFYEQVLRHWNNFGFAELAMWTSAFGRNRK